MSKFGSVRKKIFKLSIIFLVLGISSYGFENKNIGKNLSFLYSSVIADIDNNSNNERLEYLRDYNQKEGIWFKTTSGEIKSDKLNSPFSNDYNLIQLGVDVQNTANNTKWIKGFAISKKESKIDFQNITGENNNITFSLYNSFIFNDKYLDLLLDNTVLNTKYKILEDSSKKNLKYNTLAETLILEQGKNFYNTSKDFYITPFYQLNYTYVKGTSYRNNLNSFIKQNDIHNFTGKIGIYIKKNFKKSSHKIKVSGLSKISNNPQVNIKRYNSSITEKINNNDTWIEIGIDGNFQIDKTGTTYIYYSLDRTFGSDFETQWQGSLGIKIFF